MSGRQQEQEAACASGHNGGQVIGPPARAAHAAKGSNGFHGLSCPEIIQQPNKAAYPAVHLQARQKGRVFLIRPWCACRGGTHVVGRW